MEKKFSIGEALKFGWGGMKKHIGFFIALFVISTIIIAVLNSIQGWASYRDNFLVSFLAGIVSWVIEIIIGMGIIKISLRIVRGENPGLGDFKFPLTAIGNYIIASILYGLIIFGGMILLIIPGVIWGIKYQYATFAVIDKKQGPVEAIRTSGRITKGSLWNLFLFGLACLGINLLGAIIFLVGLFATIPTTLLAGAFIYIKLSGETAGESAVPLKEETKSGLAGNFPRNFSSPQ